jgi:hypothetical protein
MHNLYNIFAKVLAFRQIDEAQKCSETFFAKSNILMIEESHQAKGWPKR